jgi:5-(carboxyamino)imidazole ribonucleotide mutase
MSEPKVAIIMGSKSDLNVMQGAAEMLETFQIPFEVTVVSAHRTPLRMVRFAESAEKRGLKAIIAGAGGAAHLPGMVASLTPLPVIGVPVKSSNSLDGWDSLLSIVQMPNGVPVASVAVNASKNAAILAAQILATSDPELSSRLKRYKDSLSEKVVGQIDELRQAGYEQPDLDKNSTRSFAGTES